YTTLNTYLNGREMKVSALVTLAEATGVRLEWLATGRGERDAEAPAAPINKPGIAIGPEMPFPESTPQIDWTRMQIALKFDAEIEEKSNDRRSAAERVQLILNIYNQLTPGVS
ncbi:MAG: hypothetical protein ACREFJ_01190, partial [Acetobacteraceae bacterium]